MKLSNINLIVCACIDRREKEIEDLRKISKMVGLGVNFLIAGDGKNPNIHYDYIDDINLDHIQNEWRFNTFVINWAAKRKPKTVLFLEDDVTITKDYWEILNKIEYPEKWNRINIGGFCDQRRIYDHYDSNSIHSPYLLRSSSIGGFFGALINGDDLIEDECNIQHCRGENFGKIDDENYYKYILQPPVIIEKDIPSAVQNASFPRDIFKQAKREGRIFE